MKIKDLNEKYLKQEKKAKYDEYEEAAMKCEEYNSEVAEAEKMLKSKNKADITKAGDTLKLVKEKIKKSYNDYSSKYEDEHNDEDEHDDEEVNEQKKRKKKEDEDEPEEDEDDPGADEDEAVAEKKKKKKEALKESVVDLFDGTQKLDEDFKEKATIFLEDKIQKMYDELEEEFQEKHDAAISNEKKTIRKEIQNAADVFMNEAVTEWVKEKNEELKVAAKATISESFIADLKKLLLSHDIMLEEENQKEVIEKYNQKIVKLNEDLKTESEKRKNLQKEMDKIIKESLIESAGKDLTANEYDELKEASEEILFIDAESYAKKLKKLVESKFNESRRRRKSLIEERHRTLNEDFDDDEDKKNRKPLTTNRSMLAAKKILSGS